MYVYMHACMYVCIDTCMYVCMYVCMNVHYACVQGGGWGGYTCTLDQGLDEKAAGELLYTLLHLRSHHQMSVCFLQFSGCQFALGAIARVPPGSKDLCERLPVFGVDYAALHVAGELRFDARHKCLDFCTPRSSARGMRDSMGLAAGMRPPFLAAPVVRVRPRRKCDVYSVFHLLTVGLIDVLGKVAHLARDLNTQHVPAAKTACVGHRGEGARSRHHTHQTVPRLARLRMRGGDGRHHLWSGSGMPATDMLRRCWTIWNAGTTARPPWPHACRAALAAGRATPAMRLIEGTTAAVRWGF
jgi:hypothetical protein